VFSDIRPGARAEPRPIDRSVHPGLGPRGAVPAVGVT